MPAPKRVVRIAHAYGNSRPALKRALAADCDMIEVDMWWRGGDIRIHHERKIGWVPLLIDRKMRTHKPGKYAVRIGDYYVRPDIGTLRLEELLTSVAGKKRLLLDVKGHYAAPHLNHFVDTLIGLIRKHKAESWVAICGQTYTVLHLIRERAPDLEVRYSIERPYQWERFLRLVEHGATQVCMAYGFIDDEKAWFMNTRGVDLYCWTVDDWDAARRLVAQGVDGIISNELKLLAQLHGWVPGDTVSAESSAPPTT
jgi:Glycerophosphoryl diester phosphodiesterase family